MLCDHYTALLAVSYSGKPAITTFLLFQPELRQEEYEEMVSFLCEYIH